MKSENRALCGSCLAGRAAGICVTIVIVLVAAWYFWATGDPTVARSPLRRVHTSGVYLTDALGIANRAYYLQRPSFWRKTLRAAVFSDDLRRASTSVPGASPKRASQIFVQIDRRNSRVGFKEKLAELQRLLDLRAHLSFGIWGFSVPLLPVPQIRFSIEKEPMSKTIDLASWHDTSIFWQGG
jgi:hypothetical protein